MSDAGNPNPNPTEQPATPQQENEQRVPLGELLKERKARQDLEAKLKQHADERLSNEERWQKRAQELEPIAGQYEELRTFTEQRRDKALAALPKEARENLASVIEGLPVLKALQTIEAFAAVSGVASAREANVPRGAPPKVGKSLTHEQIEQNPSLLDGLSTEEIAALAGPLGIKTGGGRIW